ncbi:MAG: hypothetical protein ACTHJR_19075 [Sphingomonas sp.]|uniref:hypothetical protein n=1 Tax=Sphingomonas sp. TaxID=28214 RepID=UPI003F7F0564
MRYTVSLTAIMLTAAGPSDVAGQVVMRVYRSLPDAAITIVNASTLKIKPAGRSETTISLDRIRDFCSVNDADACRGEEDKFAEGIVEMATSDYAITRDRLRVIVRDTAYVRGSAATLAAKKGSIPVNAPLAEGISLVLAADFPNTTSLVGDESLKPLGLDGQAALALGTDQVLKDLPSLPSLDEVKGKILVISDYDYGASMLLRPERWRALAEGTNGMLFVAVPSDNNVLIGTVPPDASLAKLRELVSQDYATASRGVSPLIYRWSPGGWVAAK